jgi:putative transposase
VKYAAIADWANEGEYSVVFMCGQLGVSRSGYYRWRAAGVSQRERTDAELAELIQRIYTELDGNPGVRRVWADLVVRGWRVARKRVWRLMRAAGLQGRHPRAWRRTTIAGQRPVDAPDLLGQDFTASAPNTRWCGDITYVKTVDGWAYVATMLDLHSRAVVGYAVADHLRTDLVIEALTAALVTRRPPAGVIFHSDYAEVFVKPRNQRWGWSGACFCQIPRLDDSRSSQAVEGFQCVFGQGLSGGVADCWGGGVDGGAHHSILADRRLHVADRTQLDNNNRTDPGDRRIHRRLLPIGAWTRQR